MRKFKVTVVTTKEFEIEIDETKMTEEKLDEFERDFYLLNEESDRYKSMAGDYCRLRAELGSRFIEGYGYVLEGGKVPFGAKITDEEPNDAINLLSYSDYIEDVDTYVEEL